LATITPGSGFVTPSSSLAFGAIGSIVCYIALNYKHKYKFDDALDVFAGKAEKKKIAQVFFLIQLN
jgi:Amt family ammonium transporter